MCITERKQAEEALKKAHETLEEKVKERTAKLHEAYHSLLENELRLRAYPKNNITFNLRSCLLVMTKRKVFQDYEISEDSWNKIVPLFPLSKSKKKSGRPRKDDKRIFSGIFYLLHNGCQWKSLPRFYGAPSTVHDRFQEWRKDGLFENLWMACLFGYDFKKD
jgi:transposase